MSYCDWDTTDELCLRYHDEEWGVPVHDDRTQFEYLSLEVMQCGLNWTMMLHKREVMRTCFAGFDFDCGGRVWSGRRRAHPVHAGHDPLSPQGRGQSSTTRSAFGGCARVRQL